MIKPFFSIVTCTRNSSKYIEKNIFSIKTQTFKNWEQIFVDGFSTDTTQKKIGHYKNSFRSKVRFYQTKPLGISNAMNIGIKKSRGKYILILHADDSLFGNDVLKRVFSFLNKNKSLDWIYGKINVVEEDGKCIGQYPSKKIYKLFPKYLYKFYNLIPHQAVFMKRMIFDKFGFFDENLKSSMDIDLWLRILNRTKWKFLDETIADYTIRKGAQSSGMARKSENDLFLLKTVKKHLNFVEYMFFMLVMKVVDRYNKTRR